MSVSSAYDQPVRINFGWIGESFEIFKRDAWVWVLAVIISTFARSAVTLILNGSYYSSILPAIIARQPSAISPQNPVLELISGLIAFGISAYFYAGLFKMANKAVRGEPISLSDLFSGSNLFVAFLIYNFVFGFAVFFGTLACGVGILFAWILFWPGYALIADGEDVSQALSRSFNAMKQDVWNGAGFVFVLGLIGLLSCIPCFLGTLVTYPMALIIAALIYRDTMLRKQDVEYVAPAGSWPPQPGVWPPPPSPASDPLTPPPFIRDVPPDPEEKIETEPDEPEDSRA